jgi:hypothetical protein
VAEGEPVALALQHADRDALVGRRRDVVHDRAEDTRLDLGADERGRLQRGISSRREAGGPREHGVPHRRRDAGSAGGQGLGDEEGIPPRLAVQRLDVQRLVRRERADGGHRQRRQREPDDVGGREIAEHDPQGMAWPQLVVAIGEHEQRRDVLDAPAQELDQVERRLVGPMQVLEHGDDGWLPSEFVQDRREQHARGSSGLERRAQRGPGVAGDVVDGPQRPRGEE